MPEHRAQTPPALRDLESFLWWDFEEETWAVWAAAHGGAPADAGASFREALDLQEILRELEATNNGAPSSSLAWERLNDAIATYGVRPWVAEDAFEFAHDGGLVGRVLALALDAIASGAWRRFKTCRNAGCRASFFDASRNATMTWCSMDTCGARDKMRRYRAAARAR